MLRSLLLSTATQIAVALSLALPAVVPAQEARGPITLVVGYPAGGTADMGARILAEKLPALLGQPVVVENRAGAGGQIAARHVKGAPVDGSVLFFTNGHTVVTVPLILKAPGFDTVQDLRPVAQVATFEMVLTAHPSTQARTLPALMDYFAKTPKSRSIAVPAPGSSPEFIVGRLGQMLKSDVQAVAYRGAAPAVQDLLGDQVSAAVLPVGDMLQYQKNGKVHALAVTHSTLLLPGVPSFADLGLPELAVSEFLAVYAPAKLGDANVARYNAAIRQVLAMPDVIQKLAANALQPSTGTPAQLEQAHREATAMTKALMLAVDYKPQ
ncbi:tripartite tricarboxylate transporter substrate-binding protein [Hydrogenophaga sp.]|uniref:tripartite tricarboxylate transporter substrate-binding protein n=1 Tax=Hydrogenophaga sp. TaxID=1904254 RepID=UPI002FCB886A